MKTEISQAQKESMGQKLSLCLEFLKQEIQPHLIDDDQIEVAMGDSMDLCLTRDAIFVKYTRWVSLGFDVPISKNLYLEKDRKTAKKYICDVEPELAVEFLQRWASAKESLLKEVKAKNEEIDMLNNIIDSFKL